MLIDTAREPLPGSLSTDVAIVGAGAAGITLALALERLGVDCLLIDAGGEKLSRASQEFYRAALIEPEDHGPTHLYRRREFGGTTAVWGGRCIPFDPIDFEARPWIPHADWPVSHAEVAAHWPEAMAICRAGAPDFNAADPLPAGAFADPDLVAERIERFSEPTHFGRAYRDRLAAASHVRTVTGAAVTEIRTDETGAQCTGVVVQTPRGPVEIAARRTVIATGGQETPRLLLASNRALNCGLGNQCDLVGRFYQSHLEGEAGEIAFDTPGEAARFDYMRDPQGIYCRRYFWLSPEAQRREGLPGLILRPTHPSIVDPGHRNPVLSAMYLVKDLIVSEYARRLTSTERAVRAAWAGNASGFYRAHLGNILLHPVKLGAFSWTWTFRRVLARRKLPSVFLRDPRGRYPLDANAEQTPNPDSRIALGAETDAHGVPRIRVDWRVSELDRHLIARGLRCLGTAIDRAPGARVTLPDDLEQAVAGFTRVGGHHIGTARMAAGPETGVTDREGAVFGMRGLYVSGAALFPTSGFANPTLTLIALALRLSNHLSETRN